MSSVYVICQMLLATYAQPNTVAAALITAAALNVFLPRPAAALRTHLKFGHTPRNYPLTYNYYWTIDTDLEKSGTALPTAQTVEIC
jgi:hypothetical protein